MPDVFTLASADDCMPTNVSVPRAVTFPFSADRWTDMSGSSGDLADAAEAARPRMRANCCCWIVNSMSLTLPIENVVQSVDGAHSERVRCALACLGEQRG